MQERIQKLLSEYGVCSRREAERLMQQGAVCVNGVRAEPGQRADPETDKITVRGKPLRRKPVLRYLMLHKPRGYVTTLHDERGRRDLSTLLAGCKERVYPVGRLDMDSEGLLLCTNDGALAQKLMHPSGEAEKVYEVLTVPWREEAMRVLTAPLVIDGYRIRPAAVELLRRAGDEALLRMTIHEGRNRQIRKMCEQAGLQVRRLKRVQECGVSLGSLPVGTWRELTEDELALLQSTHAVQEKMQG